VVQRHLHPEADRVELRVWAGVARAAEGRKIADAVFVPAESLGIAPHRRVACDTQGLVRTGHVRSLDMVRQLSS
jgi:hypothetical protein